jgi:hypothetical protein
MAFQILTSAKFGVKVVSDEGFEVSLMFRSAGDGLGVHYREGNRSLNFDAFQDYSEKNVQKRTLEVYIPHPSKWWEPVGPDGVGFHIPDNADAMTVSELLRVLHNIQSGLEFQDKAFKKTLKFIGSPFVSEYYRRNLRG